MLVLSASGAQRAAARSSLWRTASGLLLLGLSACGGGASEPEPTARQQPSTSKEPEGAGIGASGDDANTGAGEATAGDPAGNQPGESNAEAEPGQMGSEQPEPGEQSMAPESVDPLAALLAEYRSWPSRTPEPIAVSVEIFALCRAPTLPESEFVGSEHGSMLLKDWLNAAARAGFDSPAGAAFAPGSAIVKEKLAYGQGAAEPGLVAIGVMLKREPGFAPEHGDWQFGYWEEAPGLLQGPDATATCAECHASSATDFVFLDESWRFDGEVP